METNGSKQILRACTVYSQAHLQVLLTALYGKISNLVEVVINTNSILMFSVVPEASEKSNLDDDYYTSDSDRDEELSSAPTSETEEKKRKTTGAVMKIPLHKKGKGK